MIPTDEQLTASRQRLGIPDDWQWFFCANACGEIVWAPSQAGDAPLHMVCSSGCAMAIVTRGGPAL